MQNENPTEQPSAGIDINPTSIPEPTVGGTPVLPPQMPEPMKKPSKLGKLSKKTWIILLVVLLAIGGSAAAYSFTQKDKKTEEPKSSATTQTNQQSNTNSVTGNTFFEKPVVISDLHFYTDNVKHFSEGCPAGKDGDECRKGAVEIAKTVTYYQLGKTKEGGKIVVMEYEDGPGATYYYAIEKPLGKYQILLNLDSIYNNDANTAEYRSDFIKGIQNSFDKKVSLNTTYTLSEFSFKQDSKALGQKLTSSKDYAYINFMPNGLKDIRSSIFGELKGAPQKIGTDGDKTIYKVTTSDESNFKVIEIYATYKQLVSWEYFPDTELSNLTGPLNSTPKALKISWSAGEKNSSIYFTGGTGCGTSGYVIAKNVNTNNLTSVGKTSGGQAVYQLPTTSALAQEIFTKDYGKGTDLSSASLKNLTIKQFNDKHGYFLYKNEFGEYVIYQRDDMFIRGGCAKPVIYLYPTKDTNVSVKVGADVVKSDPLYPDSGWQNVFAHPDGSLAYNGQTYDSLFWEGYGIGHYPEINVGTVVAHKDALQTIRNQLAAQGLNTKETNDFVEFWQPKLPSAPYIRLTWLGTSAMNQLAPLKISPAPQTLIRVFLDFEGLQSPMNLPKQTFVKPVRHGFTVVEWGGLLAGGIQ